MPEATEQVPIDWNSDAGMRVMTAAVREMLSYPLTARLSIAAGVLLQASEEDPEKLRTVLNERIVRYGHTGESIINVLRRAAR